MLMSESISYGFSFRENTSGKGCLGFATVRVFLGTVPLITLENCTVNEGNRGVFLGAPSRSYQAKDGTTKYQQYFYLWPKPLDGEDSNQDFKAFFEESFATAWDNWINGAAERPATRAPARAAPVTTTNRAAPTAPARARPAPAPRRAPETTPEDQVIDGDIFGDFEEAFEKPVPRRS